MRRRIAVALVALVALVGCTGGERADGSRDRGAETSSTATSSGLAGSAGCGRMRPEVDARHLVRSTIESSGGSRHYMVYVPDTYDPAVPAPLAFVFHGAGSNKEEQLAYSGYAPYADEDGALLVLPDALGSPARWSPLGAAFAGVEGVDDLRFFDDLTAEVTSTYCVDPGRVLVTGMSSGGYMSAVVGCTRSGEVAAVGPVTATVWAEPLCGEATPVAYAYFHGTDDPVVLYEGGGSRGTRPVIETSQDWAEQNGCDPDPVDERIGDDVIHRRWLGCDATTDLYTVEGGGHTWPGARDVGRLGHTTQAISATQIIWDVFTAASSPSS
ncbi:MAG: alpha/beta hydrolase family esterase [Acidimicrobiales bacterium]